jgi:hypothetical protein
MLQIFVVKKEHKSQKCAIWKTFFGLRRGDREMKDWTESKQDYSIESNMHFKSGQRAKENGKQHGIQHHTINWRVCVASLHCEALWAQISFAFCFVHSTLMRCKRSIDLACGVFSSAH